ncbi:MAG: hypothetical protein K8R90_04615 [Candidatus Cloacimonetes bacterium]|nr:hypothetical protein [Candidatus Cloacimonadota bacterium]
MRTLNLLLPLLILLMACTGEEPTETDTTPPWKPDLLEHLGDTGDGFKEYYISTPGGMVLNQIELNDENNGIDAVPDGNWIKIQWAPIIDNDVEFMKIYRYRSMQGEPEPILVDSVRHEGQEFYVDHSLSQSALGSEWNYFIDIFDRSGNYAVSDTVSYMMLEKTGLHEPADYSVFSSSDNITFVWQILPSSAVSLYRLLLFSEDTGGNIAMIWFFDETDTDPQETYLTKSYDGSVLAPGNYYWRVDAMGSEVLIDSGSESMFFQFQVE